MTTKAQQTRDWQVKMAQRRGQGQGQVQGTGNPLQGFGGGNFNAGGGVNGGNRGAPDLTEITKVISAALGGSLQKSSTSYGDMRFSFREDECRDLRSLDKRDRMALVDDSESDFLLSMLVESLIASPT